REGIASIDLDKIVDGHHLEHARQVDAALRILAQDHRRQHEMPRMFGRVLESRAVDERSAPCDGFELVGLDQDRNLSRKARVRNRDQLRSVPRVLSEMSGYQAVDARVTERSARISYAPRR